MFVLICRDKPGHLEVRKANRDAHLAYLAETGIVRLAGPLLDDAGAMVGSMLAIEAPDRAGAEAFAAADPYAKAGLFASVEIMGWKKVIG
jgi:uncharacterized protein YciI